MTTRELAKLCVFLLGLYMLPGASEGLIQLPYWVEILSSTGDDPVSRLVYYGALALALARFAFVVSLVFGAAFWAQLTFGGSRNVALPKLGRPATEEVLVGLVGILLLVLGLVQAPDVIVAWVIEPGHPLGAEIEREEFSKHLPQRARLVLQLGLGLWLLLGSNGVVALWRTVRTSGHVKGAA